MVSIAVEKQLEEMLGIKFPGVVVEVASWLRETCKCSHGDAIRPQDVADLTKRQDEEIQNRAKTIAHGSSGHVFGFLQRMKQHSRAFQPKRKQQT